MSNAVFDNELTTKKTSEYQLQANDIWQSPPVSLTYKSICIANTKPYKMWISKLFSIFEVCAMFLLQKHVLPITYVPVRA